MFLFKKRWPFVLGLILAASLLWPLVKSGYFTHHDDIQVIRLFEMDKCFKDGQIPCRWVPDLGGLYGYPLFNYYAPLPYYFGELVYFLTNNLILSSKIMFAFSFIGSYIFMYLFASKYWGSKGGAISAIFYSFAPYHAVDFYVRGAMGEMWALMFFPAILWSITRLAEKTSVVNLLLFSFFLGFLITSHNLSTMIFLPVMLIWVILLFVKKHNQKFLLFACSAIVLAIFLSAFYLLPVVFEKNLVHVDTMIGGYFSYTEHFKGFKKLFLERSWGYGASVREVPGGEKDGLSFQIGWLHLIGWLLSMVTVFILWKKSKFHEYKWLNLVIITSSLMLMLSIFLINPRSEFIWKLIDPLKYLQFPWRFLMIVTFLISFLSGSFCLLNLKKQNLAWIILVVGVVIFNFSYFKPEKFIQINDKQFLSGKNWDKQIKRSIFDFLPIFAEEPPANLAKDRYQIIVGDSEIYDHKEGTDWFFFKTRTKSHTIIRLSQYYFPNWQVLVDDQPARMEYKDNSLGLMTIILGEGDHIVTAKLYNTLVRSIANTMTLVGFIISAFLLLISFSRIRKWIGYYRERLS